MAHAQTLSLPHRSKTDRRATAAVFSAADTGRSRRDFVVGLQVTFGLAVVVGLLITGALQIGTAQLVRDRLVMESVLRYEHTDGDGSHAPMFVDRCRFCGEFLSDSAHAHAHFAHCAGCDGSQEGGPWKSESVLSAASPAVESPSIPCPDGVEEEALP